jgi:hypothetical protein
MRLSNFFEPIYKIKSYMDSRLRSLTQTNPYNEQCNDSDAMMADYFPKYERNNHMKHNMNSNDVKVSLYDLLENFNSIFEPNGLLEKMISSLQYEKFTADQFDENLDILCRISKYMVEIDRFRNKIENGYGMYNHLYYILKSKSYEQKLQSLKDFISMINCLLYQLKDHFDLFNVHNINTLELMQEKLRIMVRNSINNQKELDDSKKAFNCLFNRLVEVFDILPKTHDYCIESNNHEVSKSQKIRKLEDLKVSIDSNLEESQKDDRFKDFLTKYKFYIDRAIEKNKQSDFEAEIETWSDKTNKKSKKDIIAIDLLKAKISYDNVIELEEEYKDEMQLHKMKSANKNEKYNSFLLFIQNKKKLKHSLQPILREISKHKLNASFEKCLALLENSATVINNNIYEVKLEHFAANYTREELEHLDYDMKEDSRYYKDIENLYYNNYEEKFSDLENCKQFLKHFHKLKLPSYAKKNKVENLAELEKLLSTNSNLSPIDYINSNLSIKRYRNSNKDLDSYEIRVLYNYSKLYSNDKAKSSDKN